MTVSAPYMQRLGNIYRFRRAVPAPLRPHYGKREIVVSFGSDEARATAECRRLADRYDKEFASLRSVKESKLRRLTEGTVQRLYDLVDHGPIWPLIDAIDRFSRWTQWLVMEELKGSLKPVMRQPFQEFLERVGEEDWHHRPFLCFAWKPVEIDMDDWFVIERLNGDGTSTILPVPSVSRQMLEFQSLGQRWDGEESGSLISGWPDDEAGRSCILTSPLDDTELRAIAEAVGRAFAALCKNGALAPYGPPEDTPHRRAVAAQRRYAEMTIAELHEKWRTDPARRIQVKADWTTAKARFIRWFGNIRVQTLTTEHCTIFARLLRASPARPRKAWKDLEPYEEARLLEERARIQESDSPIRKLPGSDIAGSSRCLAAATVRSQIGWLRALLAFAAKRNIISHDPSADFSIRVPLHESEQRLPFSTEQLNAIFTSSLYAGSGKLTSRLHDVPFALWTPVIALMTGLRLGEIARLQPSDFFLEGPIPHLKVRSVRPEEASPIKSPASRRSVPLHPLLLELGLGKAVRTARSKGWPLALGQHRIHGTERTDETARRWMSDNWSRFLDRTRIRFDSAGRPLPVTFHSFRHNFQDRIDSVAAPSSVHRSLKGHSNGRYGSPAPSLEQQATALRRVSFADIDFSYCRDRLAALHKVNGT